jgi:hypothetical protein
VVHINAFFGCSVRLNLDEPTVGFQNQRQIPRFLFDIVLEFVETFGTPTRC